MFYTGNMTVQMISGLNRVVYLVSFDVSEELTPPIHRMTTQSRYSVDITV